MVAIISKATATNERANAVKSTARSLGVTRTPSVNWFTVRIIYGPGSHCCERHYHESHDRENHRHESHACENQSRESRRCENHRIDRKSTRLNSSHSQISYAVFCL